MRTNRPVNPIELDEEGNIDRPAPPAEDSAYPKVKQVYSGFYLRFDPDTTEGYHLLASSNCIIGTRLYPLFESDAVDDPIVHLDARHQQRLADLSSTDADHLATLRRQNWIIQINLATVFYEESSRRFWGEAAVMAYNPRADCDITSVETFIGHLVRRIKGGEHPTLGLSQHQFEHVLESNGAWYLTSMLPLPKIKSGEVVFKRRMSPTERLTEAAAEGNKGCLVASILFWILLVAGVIWWFFLN
jgi:hypothetical protein